MLKVKAIFAFLVAGFISAPAIADVQNSFGEITEEQRTELIEFEQEMAEAGFWKVAVALTSNTTGLVAHCGYGAAETASAGVAGTLPAGSVVGNTLLQWLRDESYNITADDLDLAVRQDLKLISFPELDNHAEMGQYYGAAISLLLDTVKYFWDYGDLDIDEKHWERLDGAMLAYINSSRVLLGPQSKCQQTWRRLKVMFGVPAEDLIQ